MPRFILVSFVIIMAAIAALVLATTSDTVVTSTRTTTQPRSAAAPEVPPPSAPPVVAPAPAPASSVTTTKKDKELDAVLKRVAELEEKLKATGKGADSGTKGEGWVDWFKSIKLPSPPAGTSAPTAAAPAPTATAPSATAALPKAVTLPTIPSPPSITSTALKGPGGSSLFSGLFSGGCSVREKEVALTVGAEPLKLTEGGPSECRVVAYVSPGAIVVARDGMGEYFLKPGVGSGRNPREVTLVAGNGFFKYSLCPKTTPEGVQLNWDCTPINR
jgi:hypothetical protein